MLEKDHKIIDNRGTGDKCYLIEDVSNLIVSKWEMMYGR